MKEGENKNISHRLIRLWQKNKNVKLEKKVSKTVCVTSILILLAAIFGGHFCFALSSANYQLTNDVVGGGGVYSTSTNYTIIDYFINGLFNLFRPIVTFAPLAGGGGEAEGKVPPPEDTTAPVISNIQVLNITQSSVRITWTTNENSSTLVDYGTMISYEKGTQTGIGGVINHEIVISNLMPSTSYHFRTRSVDAAGNSSSSLDQIFTTTADILAPIISDIVATNLTESSVTISWTTNELANSMVDYGITDAYEKGTVVDNVATTTHRISLTGLNSSTLYNFRVRSKDSANNIGSSINQTFTTLDNIAPIISSIRVVEVNSGAATILWTTDEITSGEIDYGLTRGYESGVGISAFFTKEHRLSLSDLMGNTVYHFRLTATDSAGNSSSSADFTFTTLRDALAPSNVLNLRFDSGETFMILNWTNPIERDFSGVHIMRSTTGYPRTPDEGTVVFHGLAASAVDRNLAPGTDYYYTVFSYDASENFSSGAVTFGKTLGSSPLSPEIPPIAPPGAPPIAQPEAPLAVPSGGEPSFVAVKIMDFQFLAAGETLVLPVMDEQIKTIVATQMVAIVAAEKFSKVPELVMLKIGDSNYIFNFNREKRRFESTIMSPLEIGYFDSEISIVYDKENFQFVNFKLNTVPSGFVYETSKDGEQISIAGALVTVSKQNLAGNMEVWNSGQYSQTNPVFTNAEGNYDFLVPQGFYQIKVEKEGYRVSETPVFEIKDVISNKTVELLIPPKKLLEVIEPEAPIIKNIQNVAENIGEQAIYQTKVATEEVKKVIDNPKVEKVNEQIALPTIATVAVANTGTAISFLNLLNYLRFLTTQPLLLLNRRKQKGWGRVYHAFSKLPVDLAIIRLLDAKTKKIIQTRVTDKEGRYAFIVSEGKYLISVTKPGFVFPSKYLKTAKADAGMMDIYHEEMIEIGKEGATIAANIPLDPIEKAVVPKKIALKKLFIKINHAVAISGMILSLGSFIISPTKLLGGFLLAQIFLYFLFRRLSLPKKPKTWGTIYDRKTRELIKQVVVRIFETQYNKLLETQITDGRGRYVFLVGRSSYYVTFEKEGYEPRKTEIMDFEKAARENYVAMDIGLNKL